MSKKSTNGPIPLKLEVGQTYFFQTCTKDWVGRLAAIEGPYTVVLTEASWVAESGRLHQFLRNGKADGMEIEPGPPEFPLALQWVNWWYWPHKLFTEAV